MPTEIVSTPSDSQDGKININDLRKITGDFETSVAVTSSGGRLITKINVVSVPVLIIEHLLENLTDEQKFMSNVNIRFAVTLPGQTDCFDGTTDVSNHLTVALLLETDGNELNNVGDFVITPGFKESDRGGGETICCPVITR